MSVTLEPVQTEIAEPIAEPIAEEIPEVSAENTAEIQNPIPEVEEVVPDVPEAIPETVQQKNVGDHPRQWPTKKLKNRYQKSSHNEATLRKQQRRRQIKS